MTSDRHGSRRLRISTGVKSRLNTSSRRCGCPMQLHVVRILSTDGSPEMWQFEHRGTAYTHNHPPSAGPAAHSFLRRASRSAEDRRAIVTDWQTVARAAQTLARLRLESPDVIITTSDLYNERRNAVRDELGGKIGVEYLLDLTYCALLAIRTTATLAPPVFSYVLKCITTRCPSSLYLT